LIPSALYVSLQEPDWAALVAAGENLKGPGWKPKIIAPYVLHATEESGKLILELRHVLEGGIRLLCSCQLLSEIDY